MLSHASTWQWFTCNSWSLWTDCGRSNCLAKLQQPTRLSLQRRLCDDAFAPLARQVCWHVRSKPHTQTVGRAMLSHVSTWQRFTCNSWSLWTDCGRSNCLAKLQQPTRLSLQRRLCDDAFAPLARQVCWHVRSKLNHTHRPSVEQCCLILLHDKDAPATLDHYGQTVDDQIVLQSFNSLHDYHCNVGCATMHLPL